MKFIFLTITCLTVAACSSDGKLAKKAALHGSGNILRLSKGHTGLNYVKVTALNQTLSLWHNAFRKKVLEAMQWW